MSACLEVEVISIKGKKIALFRHIHQKVLFPLIGYFRESNQAKYHLMTIKSKLGDFISFEMEIKPINTPAARPAGGF
ncbi:hypothetical protein [Allofranklinella schreckenbergeri]|uniref:hypothetical protein n=1 Tax=Allofranklinella schreckenbergeri TaxID=1076744 RepID=UPI0011C3CC79|nr:hypothetical protein [Allofranklinella schreckenbergeri]